MRLAELKAAMRERHTKITFGDMREQGVRLIYCADYRCSHSIATSADQWPDDLRLSDIEHRFICAVCGKRAPTCGRISTVIGRRGRDGL
jgi:hypothetical protein